MHDLVADPDAPKNSYMEALFGKRLRDAGFEPGPAYRTGPDGVYYYWAREDVTLTQIIAAGYRTDDIQLVIVRPKPRPKPALIAKVLPEYYVLSVADLPAADPKYEAEVRQRGFVAVHLRRVGL